MPRTFDVREELNKYREEIARAKKNFPDDLDLPTRLADSFSIALREVPLHQEQVWKDVFQYFRMRLDVFYTEHGRTHF